MTVPLLKMALWVVVGSLLTGGCTRRAAVDDAEAIEAGFRHINRKRSVALPYVADDGSVGLKTYAVVPYRSYEDFRGANPDCCVIGVQPNGNGWPDECEGRSDRKPVSLTYQLRIRTGAGMQHSLSRVETVFIEPDGSVCGDERYYGYVSKGAPRQ